MKNLICVFALAILPMMLFGQSAIDLKKDSLELAQLKIKLEKEKLTRELSDLDKKAKDDATKAQIDLYKAQKDLIGGTAPTALSGSITISKGDVTMAETRALVHRSLDKMIGEFIANLKNSTCSPIPCDDQNKKKIIIYNSDIYQSFPDYEALIKELDMLESKYNQEISKLNSFLGLAPAGVVGTIAVASEIVKSLANLATLFRTETEFKVNEEVISEEVLVSKFRMKDFCCNRTYYYPSIVPMKVVETSPLLSGIKKLDIATDSLEAKIKEFEKTKILPLQSNLQKLKEFEKRSRTFLDKNISSKSLSASDKFVLEELYNDIENEFGLGADVSLDINGLKKEIEDIKSKIRENEANLKDEEGNLNPVKENSKKLNEVVATIKTSLSEVIDEEKRSTLLRELLVAESVIDEVDKGAYTLKLTASSIGTNRIRKNLIFSTLKHSAFTEINITLFEYRKLALSMSEQLYVPFRKKLNKEL